MYRSLLFLAAVLALAFAPAPFPRARRDRSDDDPRKIQGTWEIVSRTRGGKAISHIVARAEIVDGKYTLVDAAGSWRSPFVMALGPRAKPPTIDLKSEKGTFTMTGIYELRGDSLRLCYITGGRGVRPASFEGASEEAYIDVFKRRRP
jgi:uncharacterized protein (TIGR03067 family)